MLKKPADFYFQAPAPFSFKEQLDFSREVSRMWQEKKEKKKLICQIVDRLSEVGQQLMRERENLSGLCAFPFHWLEEELCTIVATDGAPHNSDNTAIRVKKKKEEKQPHPMNYLSCTCKWDWTLSPKY